MGSGDEIKPFPWTVSAEPSGGHGPGARLAAAISAVIIAGWPLLFWLMRSQPGYHHWLRGIALPWWILVAGVALVVKLGRIAAERHRQPSPPGPGGDTGSWPGGDAGSELGRTPAPGQMRTPAPSRRARPR